MANQNELNVVLSLIDKATAPLTAFNKRVESLTKPIRDVNNRLSLFGKAAGFERLTDGVKGVGDAFGEVASHTKELAEKTILGVGLIGGALFGLVKMTADFGDRTDELSNKAGVSAQAFQEMAYAAKFSSIDAETLATTLAKMNKNIVAAVTGNKEMTLWFKRAGLSIADLKKLKPDQVFDRVLAKIDQFNKAGNSLKANGLATGILGKGGADLIPAADGFDELRKKAEELGIVMSDDNVKAAAAFNDKFDETMTVIKGVGFMIGGILMPYVKEVIEAIEEWTLQNRELIATKVSEWIAKLKENWPEIKQGLLDAWDGFKKVTDAIGDFVDMIGFGPTLGIIAAVIAGPLIASIVALGYALVTLGGIILTTPIGWIMAAIAALVAVGVLLYKNWDDIAAFWEADWVKMTTAVTAAWDTITGAISGAWDTIKGSVTNGWGELETFFTGMWDRIKSMFDGGVKYVSDKLSNLNPANLVGGFFDWTKNLFNSGGATPAPSAAQPVGSVASMFGSPVGVAPLAAQSSGVAPAQSSTQTNNAKVTVDFQNVPRGTEVKPDVGNKAPLDLSLGYSMQTF